MRRNALLFGIILLITAAGAAVTFALTGPSAPKDPIKAYFVPLSEYEELTAGRERKEFDRSALRLEGLTVPYDKTEDTFYIPQSFTNEGWNGNLTTNAPGSRICIVPEEDDCPEAEDLTEADKQRWIAENRKLRIALVYKDSYMESGLVFTGLPAVILSCEDGKIKGKEEHSGRIGVIDPDRNEYSESACSFHVRGNTSVLFDKKSYRISLRDSVGSSEKKSYLGMRTDDDWILNSLSTDCTLLREKVCYSLWEQLNVMEEEPVRSASMEFAEVFVNEEYMGVYGLMTPVDGKLMEMEQGDLLYKMKIWKEELTAPGKLTDYNGEREVLNTSGYAYAQIEYPTGMGGTYIWDPLQAYQDFVFETGDPAKLTEAGVLIDKENFVLHGLFCEMTRAADNTWKNLFIAARKDSNGNYTLSETIWDLNYTFGDQFVWDPDHDNTVFNEKSFSGYKIRYDRDYGLAVLEAVDPEILPMKKEKWSNWRQNGVGTEMVTNLFESGRELLNKSGAAQRNESKWPGSTNADFSRIYEWIDKRFDFLDNVYECE